MDNGKVTTLTLLDMSAAFDTIDHSTLLERMHGHFGISGTVFQWFKLGLERIHQVTNTIRIANIGWRIRICIREYTFFSEAINFIRQCSKFHTVIMLSNFIIIEMNEFTIFYQHQL